MQSFDVIILGGGPGGTAAARLLAQGNKRVALVEDTHWGGTCLNCGCIPTKMLLGAVAPSALLGAQQRLRTVKGSIDVDYTALQNRVIQAFCFRQKPPRSLLYRQLFVATASLDAPYHDAALSASAACASYASPPATTSPIAYAA